MRRTFRGQTVDDCLLAAKGNSFLISFCVLNAANAYFLFQHQNPFYLQHELLRLASHILKCPSIGPIRSTAGRSTTTRRVSAQHHISSVIHVGAWSLAFVCPRAHRSTPLSTSRSATVGESRK